MNPNSLWNTMTLIWAYQTHGFGFEYHTLLNNPLTEVHNKNFEPSENFDYPKPCSLFYDYTNMKIVLLILAFLSGCSRYYEEKQLAKAKD